ncbi:MAG: saccharopine dehydrogenase, partial [Erythrobacter sp.]
GVMKAQEAAKARFGAPAPRIRGRVRAMEGTFSGGTAASLGATMQAAMRKPAILGVLRDPFALTPGFAGPDQPSGMVPKHEDDLGKWAAPFVMAPINTKNVHRTNFLLGHPYGEDFTYDEMVLTSPGDAGRKMAEAAQEMMKNPFGSKPPKPGEGPTKEERENGYYDVLFVAEMPGGETLHYAVKGKYDPGYGSTSRMLAETGMALLDCKAEGGIGTPGSFLGKALVDRLQDHAEISFAAEVAAED